MSDASERVLAMFRRIAEIPRCSGKEKAISDWIVSWARDQGLSAQQDEVLNVLVHVPGTGRAASADPVILQGHLDMVCEKTPDCEHDFDADPIPAVAEGEWLRAKGTTLGADNGVAIAFALTLAEDPQVQHPPLELLFTVDEESGLTGAQKLRPGWLTGSTLINLDSEDEGVFTVGCAGGRNTKITLPIETVAPSADLEFFTLNVGGLQGGHSGVDIHLGRANANVLAARVVRGVGLSETLTIGAVAGGNAHNAIPRDCRVTLGLLPGAHERVRRLVAEWTETLQEEFGTTDPGLTLGLDSTEAPSRVLDAPSAARMIDLLMGLPHGVVRMSTEVEDLVETSTNLATVRTNPDTCEVITSQRSSRESQLVAIGERIEALARLAGGSVEITSEYPPWEPRVGSEVVRRAAGVYRELFNTDPKIEVIHAGLECGVIGAKYPGLQMISIGPTIKLPHSPDERLHLPSLDRVWELLTALLASY